MGWNAIPGILFVRFAKQLSARRAHMTTTAHQTYAPSTSANNQLKMAGRVLKIKTASLKIVTCRLILVSA